MVFGHRLDGSPDEREEGLAKAEAFAMMHDAIFSFDEAHLTARLVVIPMSDAGRVMSGDVQSGGRRRANRA